MGLVRPERFDVMTTPLNSQGKTGVPPVPAAASVNALQDALGRLSSGANPAGNTDFSRMVAQYRQADQSPEAAPRPASPSAQPKPNQADPAARALTQRLTDQALHKARMSAQLQSQRQEQARSARDLPAPTRAEPSPQAASERLAQSAGRKTEPVRPRQDGPRTEKRTEAPKKQADARPDEVGEAQTRFSTAQGDGVAWVREINPPAGVDASDPAGMMNWLAALTDGDSAATALASETNILSQDAQTTDGALSLHDMLATTDMAAQGDGAWALASLTGAVAQDNAGALTLEGLTAVEGGELIDLGDGLTASAARQPGLPGLAFSASGGGDLQGVRHASATLAPSPGSSQFSHALADQVSVWVGAARTDGPMTAELRLNPAEMGPINIKIAVEGQMARIDFAATAMETRQAIEASLGQLSKSLDDVGLSLTGGDVMSQFSQAQTGAQGDAQGQDGRRDGLAARQPGAPGDDERADPVVTHLRGPTGGGLGGLDLYA